MRALTAPLFRAYRKMLPPMSDTEREALEAGTVGWEAQLFRGDPDWPRLFATPAPALTPEEQEFFERDTNEACRLVDDWQVTQRDFDLSPETWAFLKQRGFLGLIIPKRYGGKGFSAYAHSQIVTRLSTRSSALAVTVMVPNSLGPGELLLHYGTETQKNHYLPRLARGEDIPAFALTSPWAGSDAAAIPDVGIVCRGTWQGREVLGMRVTWDKRYITLAPVCTLLGLAFRLFDPDGLLPHQGPGARRMDVGITCALVPRDHPGVEIGHRHFPLNAMFMNGPTRGRDVFMPLDFIIGGPAMAGQGWRMLMESLAAGRAISLPSSNTGMAQLTARAVGAYARVRAQFRLPIGRFEGVEEALTRIAANTYLMDSLRRFSAGAVDEGQKPAVLSAMAKYHVTERARQVVNDGMDVIGGKGICLGPSNFLGRAYQQIPIGITVEGANILTRSLILFGQGALRCHPYLLREMNAARDPDPEAGLDAFHSALWSHVAHTFKNGLRALGMGLTGSHFVSVPEGVAPQARRYVQQLTRTSAAFAFLSDVALLVLGGGLKRREKLSARLGDIHSLMTLMSAALKRFEDDGRPEADLPLLHWAMWDAMYRAQQAFDGVIANMPVRWLARVLHRLLFPWGYPYVVPSDELGHEAARLLLEPSPTRDRLTACCHLPQNEMDPVGALEAALAATLATEPVEAKLRDAERSGRLEGDPRANVRDLAEAGLAAGVITPQEHAALTRRNVLRDRVIAVDAFDGSRWQEAVR
ncbi:MAG: acyl-CoA dehydrogenase [Betaproteobacteria bacterium]|nr:acyl-CoA dehydrogenase [Betaproteobacteria bacterium]